MPRRLLVSILAATVLSSSFDGAYSADVPMSGDPVASAEVWSTFERWLTAYAAGDLSEVMAIFDEGVIFEFQGSKDESFADLRGDYEADFKTRAAGTTWRPRVEEVHAQGDLAFVRSIWELHVVADQGLGTLEKIVQRNRSLDVFCKRDGRWRIIRSINYPEAARPHE